VLPTVVQSGLVAKTDFLVDFSAFYCAGRAVFQGADPYTVEPLRTCEQSVAPGLRNGKNPTLVLPAPLPGYALVAFVPLSVLPFAIASALWIFASLVSCTLCIYALNRVTQTPWQVIAAALSLSLAATSIPLGQVVPLVVAAISLCGLFALRQQWPAASICALASLIEPHVGLFVCAGLAVWSARSRVTLAIGGLLLAVVWLFALGPAKIVEFFAGVLPAHALSEASFNEQYSLTAVLTAFGIPDRMAVHAGSAWYAFMLVAAIFVAGMLYRKSGNGAFLAWIPPAFAVFGGVFVHLTQAAVALPAAILILSYEEHRRRTAAIVALLLIAFPWRMSVSPAALLAPLFPIGYIGWSVFRHNVKAAVVAGAVAAIMIVVIDRSYIAAGGLHQAAAAGTIIDARLAEAPWREYLQLHWAPTATSWLVRAPTWLALALLLGLVCSDASACRHSAGVRAA
jgi:hypothetical protein